VIAFLSGELPPDEERRFDEHLLSCEQCWQAVKADQAARLALEKLRQPAPAGLQERVALAIALASQDEAKIAAGQRRPLAPRWRRWATAPPPTGAWWQRPAWSSSWLPVPPLGSSPPARRHPILPRWPRSSP